jgi:hypothetical protein
VFTGEGLEPALVEVAAGEHHAAVRTLGDVTAQSGDDVLDVTFHIDPGLLFELIPLAVLDRNGFPELLAELGTHDGLHIRISHQGGVRRDVAQLVRTGS